jgi:hypothetical protein
MKTCPHGGYCTDWGNPTVCEISDNCILFSSAEAKANYEAKPNRYYFRHGDGREIRFKTIQQLRSFLPTQMLMLLSSLLNAD